MFRDAWAVEREPKQVRVLDLMSIRPRIFDAPLPGLEREPWEYAAWDALTNGYFSVQNQTLFNEFWTELVSAQDALLALGAAFFDPQTVRSLFRNQQVIRLSTQSRRGLDGLCCACRHVGFIPRDLANIHVRVPQLLGELKEQYGFEQFDLSPLHSSLKLFASFVARARRHQLNALRDEALLHFIIALELIFGMGKQSKISVGTGRANLSPRRWLI